MNFVHTLVSIKYNETLKALPLRLYEICNIALWLRLVLYLPLDSHLELYISYKLAAVL